MKFRIFLINEIKRLMVKHNRKVLKKHTKIKELNKRISQLHKLTKFADGKNITFTRNSARLWLIENNFKSLPKCEMCENDVNTFGSRFCSARCQKKNFDLNESLESRNKRLEKASKSRNYDEISKKGHDTRKQNGTYDEWKRSISNALNRKLDNGLTAAEQRGITISNSLADRGEDFLKSRAFKAAETRKQNGNNSSKAFWDNLTDFEKEKYVNERSEKFRQTLIKNGNMVHPDFRDPYYKYFMESSFRHGFKSSNENEIQLLEEHGVFHSTNNPKGCVRDHLLSRRYGFENGIDPDIIAHPANCEIVLHAENVRRAKSNDNLITYEELLERIKEYK